MSYQKITVKEKCIFDGAPSWVRYAAAQPDMWIRFFEKKPWTTPDGKYWSSSGLEMQSGLMVWDSRKFDWRNTVTERKDSNPAESFELEIKQ